VQWRLADKKGKQFFFISDIQIGFLLDLDAAAIDELKVLN